jgi:NitT/TauT family transport system substrate-binding protein
MPNLGPLTVLAPVPHATTNFAPVWLADTLGYTAAEGLDYRVVITGSPKEAVEGVIAGEGDCTFVNIVFTLLARDQGSPLVPFYAFVRNQNRGFSVPVDSPIKTLADLRGTTIGLHYDDPELRQFAHAALTGAGVDPETDVTFFPLPGSPLDAPKMAEPVRNGTVQAIWQLDVFAGFMAAEGVPVRLLPAPMIDKLTPTSSFNALESTVESRPAAFAALGRAIAKATIFALTNPEGAIRLMWDRYPDSAPGIGDDSDHAFRRELAALNVRLEGHRIDRASCR